MGRLVHKECCGCVTVLMTERVERTPSGGLITFRKCEECKSVYEVCDEDPSYWEGHRAECREKEEIDRARRSYQDALTVQHYI